MAMDWTDQAIETIKVLWAKGLKVAEIGRQLGVSKNSVVGKVHRLNLDSRPSPIRPGDPLAAPTRRILRAGATTLAPLATMGASAAAAKEPRLDAPAAAPVIAEVVKPERIIATRERKAKPCCWPLWNGSRPTHRYCDEPCEPGRSYCGEHHKVAHGRPADGFLARVGTASHV